MSMSVCESSPSSEFPPSSSVRVRTYFGASAHCLTRRFATLPRRSRAALQNLRSGGAAQLVQYSAAEVSRRSEAASAPGSGRAAHSDLPARRAGGLGNSHADAARLISPAPAPRPYDTLSEAFPLARLAPYSVRKGSYMSSRLGAYSPHRETARQARHARFRSTDALPEWSIPQPRGGVVSSGRLRPPQHAAAKGACTQTPRALDSV